jgi:hypothetical protein
MINVQHQGSFQAFTTSTLAALAITTSGGVMLAASAGNALAASPTLTISATVNWTNGAAENGSCNFSGAKNLRYGANGTYVYKTLTGPVACTNAVFGDPAVGVIKACDMSDATVTTPVSSAPASRDAIKWPFASNSIWNMPVGSGARYVAANMPATPNNDVWSPMPMIDDERIVMRPNATMTPINYSSAGWSGANRCNGTGGQLVSVPMPSDFVVPNSNTNESAAFLQSDGRTLVQVQPLARCAAGGAATSMVKFPSVDLYGDGAAGAHGGSGLSAIGGSIRVGELRPGSQGPRHALKLVVYAKQVLYRCTSGSQCYRWPATTGDSYAVGFYGTNGNNGNYAMRMGALLAIPATRDIAGMGLETEPGRQLAWTLQNYGAYIVDDSYGPSFGFAAENGPDGSVRNQFQADYGYPLAQRVNGNTPWTRDVQRLQQALFVIDNNGPSSIGGGGTPRQPLAPAFQ